MRSRRRFWLVALVTMIAVPVAAVATFFICPPLIVDLEIDKVRLGQIPMLARTLEAFRDDYGRLPTEQEGLSALLRPPGNESDPYFRKGALPIDRGVEATSTTPRRTGGIFHSTRPVETALTSMEGVTTSSTGTKPNT